MATFPPTVQGFREQCKGDDSAVEAVLNHLHISDLQHRGCKDISAERLVYLGNVLKEIHATKLAHDFPDRSFEVLFDDGPKEDLTDYQLTFFQRR